jgi:RND superfamily putative drug exporter
LAALARWCFRHRKAVLPAWLLALVVVAALAHAVGSTYSDNFSFPSTDSSRAQALEKADFPSRSGDNDQSVVKAKTGTLHSPSVASAIDGMLGRVRQLPFVTSVTSPYSSGLISKDGTIGLANVQLDAQAQDIS